MMIPEWTRHDGIAERAECEDRAKSPSPARPDANGSDRGRRPARPRDRKIRAREWVRRRGVLRARRGARRRRCEHDNRRRQRAASDQRTERAAIMLVVGGRGLRGIMPGAGVMMVSGRRARARQRDPGDIGPRHQRQRVRDPSGQHRPGSARIYRRSPPAHRHGSPRRELSRTGPWKHAAPNGSGRYGARGSAPSPRPKKFRWPRAGHRISRSSV